MSASPTFIDRMGEDLRGAYRRHAARRRKRHIAVVVVVAALGATATAGAVTGVFDGFTVLQDQQANIVGTPPKLITCGASGCVRGNQSSSQQWLYFFSHRVGDGLPTSGNLSETAVDQAVYDDKGNELSPPKGAELSYACTTMDGSNLDCSPQNRVGELPRGTAIYVLSPAEYPGYTGPVPY